MINNTAYIPTGEITELVYHSLNKFVSEELLVGGDVLPFTRRMVSEIILAEVNDYLFNQLEYTVVFERTYNILSTCLDRYTADHIDLEQITCAVYSNVIVKHTSNLIDEVERITELSQPEERWGLFEIENLGTSILIKKVGDFRIQEYERMVEENEKKTHPNPNDSILQTMSQPSSISRRDQAYTDMRMQLRDRNRSFFPPS